MRRTALLLGAHLKKGTSMPHWITVEADKIKAETRRQQQLNAARTQHAALVAQTSSVFWDNLLTTVQSDVAAWNAEFPDAPEQQLAVERVHATTFRLLWPSRERILSIEASGAGISCDRHPKAADGNPGRRELPVWKWAVGAEGVIGVHEEKRTLTGEALSELLIKRMLDASYPLIAGSISPKAVA
jgi:hypothetical protein